MTIVTICGRVPNDSDCMCCLRMADCREARESICQGCRHEGGPCTTTFKRKRIAAGECKGREMEV